MKIYKAIEQDMEAVKEIINEYMDYYNHDDIDDLINEVMSWDGEDVGISFEVGYLRALEVYKTYSIQYKLKSLLAKLKSVLANKSRT